MISIEEIREKLHDRNIAIVAEKTGISRQTIYNLIHNKGGVTFRVYEILVNYLFNDK